MKTQITMKTKFKNLRTYVGALLVTGVAAAGLLTAGPSKANDAPDRVVETEDVAAVVNYRAPGVSFQQFGSAAKQLVEQDAARSARDPQWVFTRAFAWAAYEYAYNRPNYDRWLVQLNDARLRRVMKDQVSAYVTAGRPPLANPMPAAGHALTAWNNYQQAGVVTAR